MTTIALIIALGAAALRLTAGYLFGVQRAFGAREQLRAQTLRQAQDIELLREELAHKTTEQEQSLRTTIENALAPLVQREQLSIDLSRIASDAGTRRDLTKLLDLIASAGNFSDVVLSDEDGLALAANAAATEADRLAANSSLVLLMADRIAGDGRPPPLAVMLHDEANKTTLSRIFRVQDRRLSLTVIASAEGRLTPTALDPALTKVTSSLAR